MKAAPQEPLTLTPEALTDRLRRGAQFIESIAGDLVVLWSLESRESLVGLLRTAAGALEQRDDAAELRAACEAAKSALTALNRVQMYGSADMVRDRAKRALDLIDAALAATEGEA